MDNYSDQEPEIYFEEDFNYQNHKETFDRTVDDLTDYIDNCAQARRIRDCEWDSKNEDLTKVGSESFPFNGAADTEQWLSQGLMSTSTAININALRRSQIQAYPRKATDVKRASEVSVFLKYLRDAGIDNFWREAELADNYYKEKGIMVTYYGYAPSRMIPHLKRFDLEDIAESIPEIAELIADPDRIDEAIDLFNSVEGWEVNRKRARKALKQLQKTGVAEIPVLVEDEGKPEMMTLAPDTEFYAPSATQNFQDANRCYVRKPMTGQEILQRVQSEGWDEEWAEYAIEYATGIPSATFSGRYNNSFLNLETKGAGEVRDLIDVVFSYERLVDKEDGACGVYLTIWSPEFGGSGDMPQYAKRVLLPGLKKLPFVVTAPYEAKTLYSAKNWPMMLKSCQKIKKTLCDANQDGVSDAISPSTLR